MNTLSFHDKPRLWQKLIGPAKQRGHAISFCVYSYDQPGNWKKHEFFTSADEALDFARHLISSEGVSRVEIKKRVKDPQTSRSIELDFKILS